MAIKTPDELLHKILIDLTETQRSIDRVLEACSLLGQALSNSINLIHPYHELPESFIEHQSTPKPHHSCVHCDEEEAHRFNKIQNEKLNQLSIDKKIGLLNKE